MPTKEHGHIVETPVEARAGPSISLVAAVLVASLFGVIAAFALFYFAFLNA